LAFGFVEAIHLSSNTFKDVQACANTGRVSDEESQNVQAHAGLSKDLAGSLLDGTAADDEALRSVGKLLTVRQVAKLLGMCPASVYRPCDRGELAHCRVLNAIRIDPEAVKKFLASTWQRSSTMRRIGGRAARFKKPGESGGSEPA
jgi:excisionase family DNA binding protein